MWRSGETIVRREVWHGRAWAGTTVIVVEDTHALLATYLPAGAPFAFPEGDWPGGRHPWHGRGAWEGHGTLMLQRPGDAYGVWVFWDGDDRRFAGWYVNLQEPFTRTAVGYDTLDHELDLIVDPNGDLEWKDVELLDERVRDGRFTTAEAEAIRGEAARVAADIDADRRWWSDDWIAWEPPSDWRPAPLPPGWDGA